MIMITIALSIVLRALIDVASEDRLTHGAAVVARLVPETRPNRGPHDLRFALEEA